MPTTNPLPNDFFTGDYGLSKPNETVLSWTRNFYGSMSTRDWLHSKSVAVQTLLGIDRRAARAALGLFRSPFAGFSAVRAYQVFFLLPCIGLLCLPLVPLFVAIIKRSRPLSDGHRCIRDLGIACLLGFLLHFLLMMSPHWLHHYPYPILLALHLLAAVSILTFNTSTPMKCIAFLNYGVFTLWWIVLPTVTVQKSTVAGMVFALTVFILGSASLITFLLGGGMAMRRTLLFRDKLLNICFPLTRKLDQ